MKQAIKIAVIGGTGKSGKYLVKQLIKQGFDFKMILRNPEKFQIENPSVEVVEGDARNYESILALVRGCDVVLSTLGQPVGESSIFSDATKNVIKAMNACGIKRYIVTTGLHVDAPGDNKSPQTRFATDWMKENYPKITADKQVELEILSESNLDWTLVRLPMIEQTDESGEIVVSLEDCPGDKISATNLGIFMIDQLKADTYVGKSPFIANA